MVETEKDPKVSPGEKKSGEGGKTENTESSKQIKKANNVLEQRKIELSKIKEKHTEEEVKKGVINRFLGDLVSNYPGQPSIANTVRLRPPTNDAKMELDERITAKRKEAEKEQVKNVEKSYIKALGEKVAVEIESVKETGTLANIDEATKKQIHTEIIRLSLYQTNTTIPDELLDQARKDPSITTAIGPITPEQELKIQDIAIKKYAEKLQQDYQAALTAKSATEFLPKSALTKEQKSAITLDVIKAENTTNFEGETGIDIVERMLVEKGLKDIVDTIGGENFKITTQPQDWKKFILNKNTQYPESIKGIVNGTRLGAQNGEYPEGVSIEEFAKDYMGTDSAHIGSIQNKIANSVKLSNSTEGSSADIDRDKIHPLVRFLADLLAPIGAMFGGETGAFWREYLRGQDQQGDSIRYTKNGESAPTFEIEKTTSGEELILSAEKYMGRPYEMGGQGRLNIPGDPIDCSQLVINSLRDRGCLPEGFDTTASGFSERSELAGIMDGKPGDFLIRTGGPGPNHIAIITGGPDSDGTYTTIESTSTNSAGSGVIKTARKASPDGDSSGFKVYKNPFLAENKPETNNESVPEGGEEKKVVPTHYWHDKNHDKEGVDKWTEKGQTKSGVSLFDKSGNPITPETHGYGFCAVDPNMIPLGSLVIANGKKYYAVDIGSDVTKQTAAKSRGLGNLPVVDFYSKYPVGSEGKGSALNIRVIPPNKSDRSLADLKKGYTPGSIPEVDQKLAGNAKGVVSASLDASRRGDIMGALHCTDWVDKIYKKTTGNSVYNAPLRFNGVRSINRGTGIGVGSYASEGQIAGIVAGQHLIVDKPSNGNYGIGRTHSVITLGIPVNGLVKVVSYPNNKIPPKVETYDLYGKGRGNKDGKVLRIQG